ncbi:hypothetical protein ACG3SL_09285 [Sphingomonas sp. CJ20]
MMDIPKFLTAVRASFGKLEQSQVDGFGAVLTACEGEPLSYAAYILATAWHETNATMQPVREAYWLSENWRRTHLRYFPWYGRGYVQLTWKSGYERADRKLGLGGALIADPDLAMRPDIAAKVIRRGMDEGWFADRSLDDTLPAHGAASFAAFAASRPIVNGHDKADLIAGYAVTLQAALEKAGWG